MSSLAPFSHAALQSQIQAIVQGGQNQQPSEAAPAPVNVEEVVQAPLPAPTQVHKGRVVESTRHIQSSMHGPPPYNQDELTAFASSWEALQYDNLSSADHYFNSYAHFGIHEEMLKDNVRTGAYQKAVLQNQHLFKDKIVLDVGSGTGILCLFAAKAGAAHVYGIECSEIVETARKVAVRNNFADRVTYIQGKAEEVELPVDKVDIIISEWMGYFLLYESMLDTVLFARNKWLKPAGILFPDRAALYISAIEDGDYKEEKIEFWDNVYNFDYSCVKKCVMEEPIVDTVDEHAIATTACCILDLDLNCCTAEELDCVASYRIVLQRKDFLHAFVAWFDVRFNACHKPVSFTTSPYGPYTHWKQTVFYMKDALVCEKGDAVTGMVAIKKNSKNHRDLDIKISYEFRGQYCEASNTQYYRLR